jgi:hypothetical protein
MFIPLAEMEDCRTPNREKPMRRLSSYVGIAVVLLGVPLLVHQAGTSAPPQEKGWACHIIDDFSRGADGVRVGDANGDGLPDLVTGWEESGKIRICLNPGPAKTKARWPAVTVGAVGSPEDAVFVDLDGDGALDVVSCCEGRTRSVFVHWAPRDPARFLDANAWTTAAFPALKNGAMWMFCLPLQVDGEHGPDLVLGAKGEGAKIGWLEAPADPRDLSAWRWHPLCEVGWVMSLVAADLDGDGDQDILASDRKGKTRGCLWLENPGPGMERRRPWACHRFGPAGEEVMFLDHADVDRDGLADVVVPVHGQKLFVLRRTKRTPPAWETIALAYPAAAGNGKAARVGDLDRDGKPDIVLTCECGPMQAGALWLSPRRGLADPAGDVHPISGPAGPKGYKPDLIQLLDLDGDGDLDVITTEERHGLGVIWYENPAMP